MTLHARGVASLLAFGLLAAGGAHAEVSGSVTLTSDYLFRGLSQTNEEPALQGGIDYTHQSGFYAGAWGSSISWLSDADPDVSSQVEVDLYLGYGGEFGDSGLGYDAGAIYYWYPGDYPPGFTDPDTTEVYFGLGYGMFAAKYSYAVTDLFGLPDSDGSGNLDVTADWELTPGWTLNAAVGKQWVSGYEGADYAFWKLGLSKGFENGFELAAALNDNDLIGPDETFTFAVAKSF
ncbi:TorF family putative porin [Luteimonas sp. RD2P54]|uniref:TorF family putative porin n=1 Tax=Luteimonas endophytica TaxID=3042023 RepID=A0ABT6J913_9GAMM|nr:TorF family putative porin [Luteimonas endophytica]MDH5823293.1 TorF family putative porin [Luteimonas endophytica]